MTDEERYSIMARVSGYTYDQLADMTPRQQYSLMFAKRPEVMTFKDQRDYERWRVGV